MLKALVGPVSFKRRMGRVWRREKPNPIGLSRS